MDDLLLTDASTVAHLPYILDHLSLSSFAPQKWVSRLTSLMHSKEPAARWAAICIAYRTSSLSRSLLVDNAHAWVGIVFPLLSKPEPVPILRASMRYLSLVLCAAGHNVDFQRQVAAPIVPKVSSALLTIAEKHHDRDIKISSIKMLAQLLPLYPPLHKALSQGLFALCNQIFSGSAHHTADGLLSATVDLYSVLHFLGGKVGGANLWRTCLDEVLRFSWSAWLTLRSTFPASSQLSHKTIGYLCLADGTLPNPLPPSATTNNPLTTIAVSLDRLKCGVSAIRALLRAPVTRPVRVPIGHLASFCWCLLASTLDDEGEAHFDPHVRVAEAAVMPHVWLQACGLLSCLAQTSQYLLAPHMSKLITIISSHLENNLGRSQSHSFLRCAFDLLYFCPVVGATLGINRLLKATISILSPLYLPRTEMSLGALGQSKANKKGREYEAGSVFSTNNITICATSDDCDALIAALDVVDQCMLQAELAPSSRSIANRVLLSVLLSLPSIPPSSFSPDLNFHGRVTKKVCDMCVERVQGVSHAMNRSTNLVLRALSSEVLATRDKLHSHVDLLLHPRRPPFVRTLPFVESLSLSSLEETAEETATCHSLGLIFGEGDIRPVTSEPRNQLEPVRKSSPAMNQKVLPNPRRERSFSIPVELSPRTTDHNGSVPKEATTPTVPPPVLPFPAVSDLPVGPAPQKTLVPAVNIAPMLVDESDHEEIPTIDVDSDSELDA